MPERARKRILRLIEFFISLTPHLIPIILRIKVIITYE
jgi:hypothetical protein